MPNGPAASREASGCASRQWSAKRVIVPLRICAGGAPGEYAAAIFYSAAGIAGPGQPAGHQDMPGSISNDLVGHLPRRALTARRLGPGPVPNRAPPGAGGRNRGVLKAPSAARSTARRSPPNPRVRNCGSSYGPRWPRKIVTDGGQRARSQNERRVWSSAYGLPAHPDSTRKRRWRRPRLRLGATRPTFGTTPKALTAERETRPSDPEDKDP